MRKGIGINHSCNGIREVLRYVLPFQVQRHSDNIDDGESGNCLYSLGLRFCLLNKPGVWNQQRMVFGAAPKLQQNLRQYCGRGISRSVFDTS